MTVNSSVTTVMIWDDVKRQVIYEVGLPSQVKSVRWRKDRWEEGREGEGGRGEGGREGEGGEVYSREPALSHHISGDLNIHCKRC